MGENVTDGVVSFRLSHEEIEDLRKIAEDRGLKVNAILRRMISRRIREIRKVEGW